MEATTNVEEIQSFLEALKQLPPKQNNLIKRIEMSKASYDDIIFKHLSEIKIKKGENFNSLYCIPILINNDIEYKKIKYIYE